MITVSVCIYIINTIPHGKCLVVYVIEISLVRYAHSYTCQLSRLKAWVSRLRAENFDLTPAHAWLKNVSCCRLAWHNFQKYVNSDPRKEWKPCVKGINDNTFLAISDFVDKHFLDNFAFGRLRTSSDFFRNLQKWSCCLQKPQHSQDKNLTLTSQKKLAGIHIPFFDIP